MIKKSNLAVVGVLTLTLASGFFAKNIMAANTPGTSSDPLVTKSYVDEKISQIISQVGGGTGTGTATNPAASASTEEIVSDVVARMEFLYGDKLKGTAAPATPVPTPPTDTTSTRVEGVKYLPVNLLPGQGITGHEGTEIILRSGKAKGKATGENGLVDATDGTEIRNDSEVKMNHIIIVPRADGRGVTATTDAWFLVKGGYDIVN